MAVNLSPVGGVAAQFFNNDGTVLSGGKLNTYTAGTTTPATTYTTSAGSIAHSNPIQLNSAGRVPASGEIWLTDGITYKFVLTDANDVLIATYDNISGINSNFINFTNEQEIQTATAGQTVFTLTTMQYQPGTGSLSVFVDGVNQYGPGAQYAFTETSGTVVTFVTGLHVGASVKFTTSAINASSYGNAFQISYTPPFTGAVTTNVGDKLAQTVSVEDFGGDVQVAIDALSAGDLLIIGPGNYTQYDININQSNIVIQNYGNFTLPANARASIFKFAEGISDVVFINYGILDHNKANQGNLNTITTGTAVFEVSNAAATNFTYRVQIQNYGTIKNGANNGIYYHTRVADLAIDPVGYITGCRNDGISGSALNYRVRIANGILTSNGAYGSNINADSDYIEIDNVQIKGTTLQDDGVTPGLSNGISIGHSGTPPETAFRFIISNCHIYDIDNSTVGILVKSGLSDQSIIANSSIHRTNGDTSGGVAIRIVGGVANGEGLVISGNSITGPWGVGVSSWDFSSTGFVTDNVVISGNFIDTSAFANSVGVQLYSGSDYTISGNRIKAALYGIETQLPYVSITGNRIVSASVGVKVKDGSDYLVCSTNNIFASTDANAVVLDAYDDGRSIGLNRKQTLLQSGIPIQPLVVGSGATNPAIASKENGGTSSFTCTLNNQVSGKTTSTFTGGMYFVSNVTDGTHAIFVWTSATASGGFAILSSQGANWSTTYNAASKEGIAFNASTEGPFIFSNLGGAKQYQVICFGGF